MHGSPDPGSRLIVAPALPRVSDCLPLLQRGRNVGHVLGRPQLEVISDNIHTPASSFPWLSLHAAHATESQHPAVGIAGFSPLLKTSDCRGARPFPDV